MPIATNAQGDTVYLDPADSQWKPAKIAANPQTGEKVAFDGQQWQKLKQPTPEMNFGQQMGQAAKDMRQEAGQSFQERAVGTGQFVDRLTGGGPGSPVTAQLNKMAGGLAKSRAKMDAEAAQEGMPDQAARGLASFAGDPLTWLGGVEAKTAPTAAKGASELAAKYLARPALAGAKYTALSEATAPNAAGKKVPGTADAATAAEGAGGNVAANAALRGLGLSGRLIMGLGRALGINQTVEKGVRKIPAAAAALDDRLKRGYGVPTEVGKVLQNAGIDTRGMTSAAQINAKISNDWDAQVAQNLDLLGQKAYGYENELGSSDPTGIGKSFQKKYQSAYNATQRKWTNTGRLGEKIPLPAQDVQKSLEDINHIIDVGKNSLLSKTDPKLNAALDRLTNLSETVSSQNEALTPSQGVNTMIEIIKALNNMGSHVTPNTAAAKVVNDARARAFATLDKATMHTGKNPALDKARGAFNYAYKEAKDATRNLEEKFTDNPTLKKLGLDYETLSAFRNLAKSSTPEDLTKIPVDVREKLYAVVDRIDTPQKAEALHDALKQPDFDIVARTKAAQLYAKMRVDPDTIKENNAILHELFGRASQQTKPYKAAQAADKIDALAKARHLLASNGISLKPDMENFNEEEKKSAKTALEKGLTILYALKSPAYAAVHVGQGLIDAGLKPNSKRAANLYDLQKRAYTQPPSAMPSPQNLTGAAVGAYLGKQQ